jgi:cold-inducible RNA-binding protein
LSFDTTQEELSALLSQAGKVARVHIGTDRETGRSRGFAFAEFGSDTEAADAIRKFDGYDLGGRRLRVNNAEDRPQRPAGGPGGGAGGGYRPSPSSPRPSGFTPPPQNMFAAGDPFASEMGGGMAGRPNKSKGSRRGLRARKRSLGGY